MGIKKDIIAPKDMLAIYHAILTKSYRLSDFDDKALTSRNLKFWEEEGLLLVARSAGEAKWSIFSFVDYTWLKLLLFMHSMGVAKKDKVAMLRWYLATQPGIAIIPNIAVDLAQALLREGGSENEEMIGLARVIADSLFTKAPVYIRLYKDGRCEISKYRTIPLIDETNYESETVSFIQISLKEIFADFVRTMVLKSNAKEPIRVGIVTNQEGTLLGYLENGLVSKIHIQFPSGGVKEAYVGNGNNLEIADLLCEYMVQANYSQITYTTTEGGETTIVKKALP